jgi:nitrogen fixation/metabolism regulation signal transduction histidine kinase
MGFKSFRAQVAIRVLLLGALILVGAWGWGNTEWQATPIVCAVLAVLLLLELLRYVESVNRELAGFLQFVAHHDFSVRLPLADKGAVFRELEDAYTVLTKEYRNLNLQRAANHQYLESVIEHVSIALVCFDDETGAVKLMNQEAQELFKVPHLASIKSFRRIDASLPALIASLPDGGRALISVTIADEPLQLALYATKFQLLVNQYRLVSFQNIADELEQREIDYSQKLIKILRHEIMNSVTPILSLTKWLGSRFGDPPDDASGDRVLTSEERTDLARSVASIESRGGGLLRFVQAYGTLANLPRPNVSDVNVAALFERVRTLMAPTIPGELLIDTDSDLTVRADPQQIEQVLINLVKNAGEALAGSDYGRVVLRGSHDQRGRVMLQVIDNGPGIPEDQVEDIFVPFFTTKKGGSGVGLSVSRQLMVLNRGSLNVKTVAGRGSEFTLRFK